MHQRLQRRRRVARGYKARPELLDHVFVGKIEESAESLERGQVEPAVPLGLDADQVATRGLDVEDARALAEDVGAERLDRRVPSAVQHE